MVIQDTALESLRRADWWIFCRPEHSWLALGCHSERRKVSYLRTGCSCGCKVEGNWQQIQEKELEIVPEVVLLELHLLNAAYH